MIGHRSIVASVHIESQHSVDNPWVLVFQNFNAVAEDSKLWGVVIFIFNGADDGRRAGQGRDATVLHKYWRWTQRRKGCGYY